MDNHYANAYFQRGQIYIQQKQPDKAIADLDAAIKLAADADAYYYRGTAYALSGNADKALTDFNNALKLKPHHFNTLMARGKLFASKKEKADYEKAIADFDKAQGVDNKKEAVFYQRALVYLELAEYDRALNDFDSVKELNPKRADVYDLRAQTYLNRLHSPDKALPEAMQAVELEPNNVTYLNHRAAVYIRKERYEDAWRTSMRHSTSIRRTWRPSTPSVFFIEQQKNLTSHRRL